MTATSEPGEPAGQESPEPAGRESPEPAGRESPEPAGRESPEPADLRPLTMIRRVVARRMTQAAQTIPAVTLHRDAAFARLLDERRELGVASGHRPSVDAILAAIVGRALVTHDLLNGSWVETPPAVEVHPARNVAIAVDTPLGLVAVVLGSADTRAAIDLDTQLGEMVARARAGRLLPGDVSGATFTISNLGGLGIDAFTPIITPPQAAVLGVGAARGDGDRHATLSLTFDHRITDGADAARFLADIVAGIVAGIPGDRATGSGGSGAASVTPRLSGPTNTVQEP